MDARVKPEHDEGGAVRSYATFPEMEEIEGLVGEYAGWAG